MTKKATGTESSSRGRAELWVDPGEKGDKSERVPAFPWPRSKVADQSAREFQAPLLQALESLDSDAIQQAVAEQNNNPEVIAARLIGEVLQTIHLDPRVHRDAPWLGEFVMMMRELVADHVPGMTLVQMLAPLQTALSQHGGGRPKKVDPEAVLRVRHHLDAAWNPAPTKEAAQQLGTSERNVRKIVAKAKKSKPG